MEHLAGRTRQIVTGAAAIAVIAVSVRAVASHALLSSLLVGCVAVVAVLVGLSRYAGRHDGQWRLAWAVLGLGLAGQVVGTVLQALYETGSAAYVAGLSGGLLLAAGLVVMIHRRQPGRAAEFLFEAMIGAVGSGYVLWVLATGTASAAGGTLLGALGLLIVDVAVVWLAARLTSMSAETPAAYRYLLAGLVVRLTADAVVLGGLLGPLSETLPGSAQWRALVLWGYCLWAAGALHPSMRASFEPVSSPSRRLGVGRIAFVTVAVLVPAIALALHGGGTDGIAPTTLAGSMIPPLVVAAYLMHQVQERASREYRAQHDALTGLPNRVLFHDRVEVALTQARRRGHRVGMMFLDLDRFKNINDSLGHDVGNQLLQAVAKRLRATLREEDTVARLGGDEFTILLSAITDADECTLVARKVARAFDDPFLTAGRELFVSASVGVAVFPDSADDVETLLKNADTAMYSAKAHGRNGVQRYSQDMSARASVKLALESSLHGAVERGHLTVHYQPQVDLRDGRIVGLEALARWYHPELGFVSPAAFIPLAEESGLILELGERVLTQACRQNQEWHEAGLLSVPVAVNMSPRQFVSGRVLDTVSATLDRTGLPPELLELELTESVFMRDLTTTTSALRELRSMGIGCSIDDFGTGFSALNYLAELPIDALKIDRSFVSAIADEHDEAPIVGAIIALADQLGMRVIAEGVETSAQTRHLRRLGCHFMQGYRFGRPVPAGELEQRLFDGRLVTGISEDELGPILSAPSDDLPPMLNGDPDPAAVTALLVSAVQEGDGAQLDPDVLELVLAALRPDDRRHDAAWWRRSASLRLAAGTMAGLIPLSGGLVAAGALPPSAQSVAADLLGHVGIRVPAGERWTPETPLLLAADRRAFVPETSDDGPVERTRGDRGEAVHAAADVPTVDVVDRAATPPPPPTEEPTTRELTTAQVQHQHPTVQEEPEQEPEEQILAASPPDGTPPQAPSTLGRARTRPETSAAGSGPRTGSGGATTPAPDTDVDAPGAGDAPDDGGTTEDTGGETPADTATDADTTSDTDGGTTDETTSDGTAEDTTGGTTDDGTTDDGTTDDGTTDDGTTDDGTTDDGTTDDGATDDEVTDEAGTGTDTEGGAGPGQSDDAPGQTGDTPGQDGTAPGQDQTPPGDPPGQTGDTPGQDQTPPEDPPGQTGDTPGQDGTAPGQDQTPPEDPPGQTGDTPGQDAAATA